MVVGCCALFVQPGMACLPRTPATVGRSIYTTTSILQAPTPLLHPPIPTPHPPIPIPHPPTPSPTPYRIVLKKFLSLIPLLLAPLIALLTPSLASPAFTAPATVPSPPAKSTDCSSTGTFRCAGSAASALSPAPRLLASRRCFFDFAVWGRGGLVEGEEMGKGEGTRKAGWGGGGGGSTV